jgi:DNA-binding transcriptional regulator YiaG
VRPALKEEVLDTAKSFVAGFEAVAVKSSTAEKRGLTNVNAYVNNASMSPMAQLLARLRKATECRGKKSELASLLGVQLAAVSQWLSGERQPSGDTTLRLLEWVQVEEEKNSGSVSTTTGAKTTRRKKKGHETTKSSTGQSKR